MMTPFLAGVEDAVEGAVSAMSKKSPKRNESSCRRRENEETLGGAATQAIEV